VIAWDYLLYYLGMLSPDWLGLSSPTGEGVWGDYPRPRSLC